MVKTTTTTTTTDDPAIALVKAIAKDAVGAKAKANAYSQRVIEAAGAKPTADSQQAIEAAVRASQQAIDEHASAEHAVRDYLIRAEYGSDLLDNDDFEDKVRALDPQCASMLNSEHLAHTGMVSQVEEFLGEAADTMTGGDRLEAFLDGLRELYEENKELKDENEKCIAERGDCCSFCKTPWSEDCGFIDEDEMCDHCTCGSCGTRRGCEGQIGFTCPCD